MNKDKHKSEQCSYHDFTQREFLLVYLGMFLETVENSQIDGARSQMAELPSEFTVLFLCLYFLCVSKQTF